MFDPWRATLPEAEAAHRDSDGPVGAVFQWAAAQKLKEMQARESRDGFDVLWCVAECATHGLVMPDWLVAEYLRRYRAVQQLHVDSWADPQSFGRAYPKGAQVQAMRRRRVNRVKVGLAVTEFVKANPDKPLDSEWERIGEMVAKSDKEAQKLFSEAVASGLFVTAADLRRKLGWPSVPPKFRKVRGRQK
jgi:hypothetical protein